jgi:hypothetical protein
MLFYSILGVFSSVPVEEQEEFKQLTDDIQELQQSLNQEFRQKTVSVVKPCSGGEDIPLLVTRAIYPHNKHIFSQP